ncbi:MAG: aminoacyl-tRNA hydrolase [Myxococcales bacterium]|nr:aminoacyl-tRNA hydrolase [Myxococcales bacterium]MCB9644341.1 aminoacyl-tRNA hydrolase [Myxococcales bacterium]
MWVIVGLGNPGTRYANDRHNIGFQVVEALGQRWHAPAAKSRFQALISQTTLDNEPALLVQPQTYMNLSGQAVAAICSFYQVTPEHVLVVHDELDLPFGQLRLKQGGGDGGHRGLRSISAELGSPKYTRLRFGIGRPDHEDLAVADFVLSPFSTEQKTELPALIEQSAEMLESCLREGLLKAMNLWNRKKAP